MLQPHYSAIPAPSTGNNGVGHPFPTLHGLVLTLSLLHRESNSTQRLTNGALANVPNSQTSQLDTWQAQPESHEQLAAGEEENKRAKKAKQGAQKRIEEFFHDIEIDEIELGGSTE